jgi:hypothetical protein
VISVAGRSWEEYLSGPQARRRRRFARQLECLLGTGRARVRCVADARGLEESMPVLMSLHEARFGSRSTIFTGRRREFFTEAARAMFDVSALCLRVLEIDGRPAAALLGFWWTGDEWFYQSGWHPDFADDGAGRALLAWSIRDAFLNGRRSYRLLRGDEPYKFWWATADAPVVTVAIAGPS